MSEIALDAASNKEAEQEWPAPKRRYILLAIFALTIFIDVLGASAFFVFTGAVSKDLDIIFAQQSWVINAYAVTFASFLVFWGKLCALLGSKRIFVPALMAVGVLSLILSFLTDKYAFLVFRGFSGIAAAALVPSAYRLIGITFPPEERPKAYTLYGMTGSIANVTGTLIAGVIALIPRDIGTQMVDWRWFFRLLAVLAIPGALVSFKLIPKDTVKIGSRKEIIKRLDVIGVMTLQVAIILFIVGLTLGASYGWDKATFLAPFLISCVLFPLFFWHESRLEYENALIPTSIWRLPNFAVLIFLALITLGWWSVMFLPFIEMFHDVHGESYLLAALRVLPVGISAGIISVVLVMVPRLIARPKWPMVISLAICAAAYTLWTQTPSPVGINYWRFVFPGMLIGSAGMQVVLLSTNVGLVLAAPPEQAGLVGAVYQTAMQSSTVIALSIQAGLMTLYDGGVHDFRNVRASWYFELGWTVVWFALALFLYRPKKNIKDASVGEPADAPIHMV